MAGRLGAVSRHRSIQFWALMRQEWRPLVVDSWSLDGPQGRDFHFVEQADVAGRSIWRLHVTEHSADRLVLEAENVTAIRRYLAGVPTDKDPPIS